ncbi:UDP-N-acetylglucosamine transferase subunit ALG14 homolog isoform X3 [Phocoena sinus]|uniref:UDP-N-acetylglucosamine transferase subunit ALG14 homolog isoform X3 n=1 Tax=Phocoena sinus TaxID=42100 RepID=UPI0013C47FD1|nr:UDP-N-acetylglucosamine transferase subunit ALG14 homolog isoform X3 [Phocoena sinus]
MGGTLILAAAAGAVAVLLAVRLWVVLRPRAAVPRRSLSLLVVAGSGGHTTEILRLLENLSDAYCPRHYIIADTDEMSAHKINSFEGNRADRNPSAMDHLGCWINSKGEGQSKERSLGAIAVIQFTEYYIHRIPRSREVQQSWLSTVLTTLYSMWLSFPLTHRLKPDLGLYLMLLLCPCSTLGHTYYSSGQNVAIKCPLSPRTHSLLLSRRRQEHKSPLWTGNIEVSADPKVFVLLRRWHYGAEERQLHDWPL